MSPLTDCSHVLRRLRPWLPLALVAGITASACAKKPVVVAAEPPPLAVPVVPPRLVGPVLVEEEPPQPVEEVPERPAPKSSARPPRVATPKPADAGATDATKPEPADPAPPASSEQPPLLLRTPETADDQETIRRVRDILARAQDNLSKVNYKALSTGAKAQHDTAARFIAQAEEALQKHSFTFARYLADKAEVLSGSLVNR